MLQISLVAVPCYSLWHSLSQVAVSTDNATIAAVAVSKTSVGPTVSTIVRLGISRPLAITIAKTTIAVASIAKAISKSISTIVVVCVSLRVSGPLAITIAKTTIAVAAIAKAISTIAVVCVSLRVS